MKSLKKFLTLITVVVFVLLIFPRFASAYIDPGTGSYIIQLIIAAVVGASFAIKIYWRKLISFFKRILTKGGK